MGLLGFSLGLASLVKEGSFLMRLTKPQDCHAEPERSGGEAS
jgi:hypothetical protein